MQRASRRLMRSALGASAWINPIFYLLNDSTIIGFGY
jgi:hypothetical protein